MKLRSLTVALLFAAVLIATTISSARADGFAGVPFTKIIYVCGTTVGTGNHSGDNPANCLPFADQNLWAIPAGTEISSVKVLITTLITGTADIDIGDTDQSDDYVDGSVSLTLGTVGLYSNNAKVAGAYLRVQTAGATDAGDIYVVPTSKYYPAAGKNLTMDITTANTAGALQVIVSGFRYKI